MRFLDRPRVLCLPSGPDEYAMAVVRALASRAEVELVAPAPLLERFREDIPASTRVHALRWPRHRDPRNLGLLLQIMRVFRHSRPDVVHFLGDSVVWLVLGLPVLRRRPLVVTVHDVDYHPGDTQSRTVPMATIRLLRRAADAVVVHGEGLRRDLLATGISPSCGIHPIAHPVLDRHARLAERLGLKRGAVDGRPVVLFFGRVVAYKGLGLLIEASDAVVKACPGARFVIAGQGPDLDRLRNAVAERPWFELRDRYIPDTETAQLFLDATLVALPYVEASQSGVVALAAGFGRAVVATSVGELGPLVRSSGMGPVVPPQASALAHAIIHMLTSPQRLAQHEANATAAGQQDLSLQRVADATLQVYRRASSRCHDAAPRPFAAWRRWPGG